MNIDKHCYYHLNIFGRNWPIHGKQLFDDRLTAISQYQSLRKKALDYWHPLKVKHIDNLLFNGITFLRIDGRKINDVGRYFSSKAFCENKNLIEGIEDDEEDDE